MARPAKNVEGLWREVARNASYVGTAGRLPRPCVAFHVTCWCPFRRYVYARPHLRHKAGAGGQSCRCSQVLSVHMVSVGVRWERWW